MSSIRRLRARHTDYENDADDSSTDEEENSVVLNHPQIRTTIQEGQMIQLECI